MKQSGRTFWSSLALLVTLIQAGVGFPQEESRVEEQDFRLRGDPEDLTPLHPKHFQQTPPKPLEPPKPILPKVWKLYRPTKGESGDLAVAATGHKPRRQSYNRNYNPKPRQYSTHNRHSDGGQGKGGYHKSDSYQGKNGYSSYSSFDRANKNDYKDADHQTYGDKDGGSSGGSHGGSSNYGNYGGEYGDDGRSYTSAGEDYKK